MKDDHAIQTSLFKEKLSVAETTLIAKYYPTGENIWTPSLIAFPHFQTFPSRVHKVMHANRTGMLIDMMQRLQGLSFSGDSEATVVEVIIELFGRQLFSFIALYCLFLFKHLMDLG